jgi:crotonobetainyl-CoA:carnitine CoA-transferase CaiB-like acyl-CoA transferase
MDFASLTRVLGGPYCTQMLGDYGADILKIEPPGGDETRAWRPPFQNGLSSYFLGGDPARSIGQHHFQNS